MSKKNIFIFIVLVSLKQVQAQFISEVLEYKPAPGQFINTAAWGLPSSAESLQGTMSGALSLGAFGGYVVFKFDNPVENHVNNPYGIDFVIYGNPLKNLSTPEMNNNVTWAEPGIVSVMKDENNNGLPDDTWFELAGSDYFFSTTQKNYEVTYTNPGGDKAADVPWTDNLGDSGYVYANSFHSQVYYPLPDNFPEINATRYTLKGTRIKDYVDRSNPSFITAAGRPWGYVDNNLRNTYNGLPDNPYTDNIEEGSGGDAFDIDWAVDANGNYVELDRVDFIKVHNGTFADAGWLGEVSTEITGAFDVAPDASVSEWDSTSLVLNNIPVLVNLGERYQLEAAFFVRGRKTDVVNMKWTATPESKVSIDENNLLTTIDTGKVTLTASCSYAGNTYSASMITDIIAPASVEITFAQSEIQAGQKYPIKADVKDQNGGILPGLSLEWETSNNNVKVVEESGNFYLAPEQTGSSRIYVYPAGYPDIRDSIDLSILKASDTVSVYLTIKTGSKTVLPKTKIQLGNFDLVPFITEGKHHYGLSSVAHITAAHALASVFENVSFESDLRFKDSEDNGLYIYKLPVRSGSRTTYYYGYGNNSTANTGCWLVNIGDNTHFRDLEDVLLFENDEITAYYVDDITTNWDVYTLMSSATSIGQGVSIDLSLSKESFYLYSGTTIMSAGTSPAKGKIVYHNGEVLLAGKDTVRTDEQGKVTLTFNTFGVQTINIATEQLELVVDNNSGIHKRNNEPVTVYPNPANNRITLSAPSLNGKVDVQVFSLTGENVVSRSFNDWTDNHTLNTGAWNNGFYLLRVITSKAVIDKMIVVKH